MMKKILCLAFVCALLMSLAAASSYAAPFGVGDSFILESRDATGATNPWFSTTTFAAANGFKSTAEGLAGLGSYYSGAFFGDHTATFTAEMPVAGVYEVFVTYPNPGANGPNVTQVQHTVGHNGILTPVVIDQSVNGNVWVSLGTFDFLAGAGTVMIDNNLTAGTGSHTICADSVKFTLISVPSVPEPGSLLALGTGLIGLLGMIRRKK